jgi:hypothetical protein
MYAMLYHMCEIYTYTVPLWLLLVGGRSSRYPRFSILLALRMNHSRIQDGGLLVIEVWIGVYKDVRSDGVSPRYLQLSSLQSITY